MPGECHEDAERHDGAACGEVSPGLLPRRDALQAAKRVERLIGAGFSPDRIGRIRAPIGLDIGAVSPAEIAASILAQIIEAQRKKPPRPTA